MKSRKDKKKLNFGLLVILVIIGSAILRNFNFRELKFEPFWQSMLFIATFLLALFFLFNSKRKEAE